MTAPLPWRDRRRERARMPRSSRRDRRYRGARRFARRAPARCAAVLRAPRPWRGRHRPAPRTRGPSARKTPDHPSGDVPHAPNPPPRSGWRVPLVRSASRWARPLRERSASRRRGGLRRRGRAGPGVRSGWARSECRAVAPAIRHRIAARKRLSLGAGALTAADPSPPPRNIGRPAHQPSRSMTHSIDGRVESSSSATA